MNGHDLVALASISIGAATSSILTVATVLLLNAGDPDPVPGPVTVVQCSVQPRPVIDFAVIRGDRAWTVGPADLSGGRAPENH